MVIDNVDCRSQGKGDRRVGPKAGDRGDGRQHGAHDVLRMSVRFSEDEPCGRDESRPYEGEPTSHPLGDSMAGLDGETRRTPLF